MYLIKDISEPLGGGWLRFQSVAPLEIVKGGAIVVAKPIKVSPLNYKCRHQLHKF